MRSPGAGKPFAMRRTAPVITDALGLTGIKGCRYPGVQGWAVGPRLVSADDVHNMILDRASVSIEGDNPAWLHRVRYRPDTAWPPSLCGTISGLRTRGMD
jgi:hypothetical protein